MKSIRVLSGMLVFLLLSVPAWAQLSRATLTGTVTDTSGAVIPGVSVMAINQDTGVKTSGVTNNVGIYRIPDLEVGHYSLSFKKSGFQAVQRTGIALTIGQVADISLTMKVGQVTQTVQVKANASILETQTSTVGGSMTNQAIQALPLDVSGGRDIQQFAFETVPSVEGDSWSTWSAGGLADSSEVLIDGTLATEYAPGLVSESNPPFVAVQEFKVDTGGMGGQTGMYTGGTTFEYHLKSGTNQFHGTAQYFLQNEVLDANSFGNNLLGIPRARNRRDDEAVGFGGPIYIPHVYNGRDKSFFYFAFEREKEANFTPGSLSYTVPTNAFMNGNFSALLGAPYCTNASGGEALCSASAGYTNPVYVQNTNGQSVPLVQGMIFDPASANGSEVFPNNQIPTTMFSKNSLGLLKLYQKYYTPMGPGDRNNFQGILNNDPSFEEKNWSIKLNHTFSPTDRISGSFYITNRPRLLDDSNAGPWSSLTSYGGPFSGARNQLVTTRAWRANWTHIFSSNVVNTAALTYERFAFGDHVIPSAINQWPSGLFAGSNKPAIIVGFSGNINGVGESSISTGNSGGLSMFEDYVADDSLSWLKGRHTITVGGEWRAFQLDSGGVPGTMNYNFSNSQTGMPNNSVTGPYEGFAFASFLLGDVGSASMSIPGEQYGRRKSYSLYAQDSWKVSNRLTANYGLTWNVTFPLHEKYGRWANFNTSYVNSITGERGEIQYLSTNIQNPADGGGTFENMHWDVVAPHIGFAYRITRRVVARAAYSIFDIPYGMGTYCGVPYCYAPGYFPNNQVSSTGTYEPAFNWDSGYPGQTIYATTLSPSVSANGWYDNASISPRNLIAAYNEEVNAGVQIELTPNTRLTINYLGTWGKHLKDGSLKENAAPIADYAKLAASGDAYNLVDNPATAAAAGVPYPYQGFSGDAWQALAPFANVAAEYGPNSPAAINYVGNPLGWWNYNALQIDVHHRTSHGLTLGANYVFSSDMGTFPNNYTLGGGGTWLGSNFQDTYAGYSYWYQNLYNLSAAGNFQKPYTRTYVKAYVVYDLPFGSGRAFFTHEGHLVNGLVGGWTVSSLLGYSTGSPLAIYSNNYYPGALSEVYSNVAAGADLSRHFNTANFNAATAGITPDPNNMYFNPAGFSNPTYGQLGDSGPYVAGLKSFGNASEDASLYKNFTIKEKIGLQFRISFFDIFNRHYYPTPDTNISDPLFGQVTGWPTGGRYGQASVQLNW